MFQFLHLRYISLLIAIYRRKKKIRNWPKKPCNSISQSLFHFHPYTYNTSFQKKNKFSKEENNSKHFLRFDFCIFYDNSPRSSKIHFLRLNSSIYIRYPSVHGEFLSAESWPRNFISRHWGSIPPLRSTRLKTDGRWHLAESSVTQRRIEWESPIDSTRNG